MASSTIPQSYTSFSNVSRVEDSIYAQAGWTCPADGIALAIVNPNSSSAPTTWNAFDNTASMNICYINKLSNGLPATSMFPVVRSHVYTTNPNGNANVGTVEVYYFKFS